MKEDLFKKILILGLLLNVIHMDSTSDNNYTSIDFVPYNESKTSVGINLYDNLYSKYELVAHNWFTDNLYFTCSFRPFSVDNDMKIKYNLSIGYSSNFNSIFFKNLVFSLGYNKLRYNKNKGNDYKTILYSLLLNMKIKSVWIFPSYGKIDDEYNTNQYGLGILRSFKNKLLLIIGVNYSTNNVWKSVAPYISIRYNI